MNILIRSAEIIDTNSSFHKKNKNIFIKNGKIESVSDAVPKADIIIEGEELKVSAGWFDLNTYVGDPGYEHKEDIETVSLAASSGGFTGLACQPNTNPPIQSKDVISYIHSRSLRGLVEILPIGSITLNSKGEELTEMIDLQKAGAVAFSDGDKSIWHSDILLKAIQYNQKFGGLVIQKAQDKYLTAFGQMNEGRISTSLGLKGIPTLAEDIIVQRDLKILEYTGGRLHFSTISSPVSINLIKEAKKKGLNVTCDIAAYNLALDDSELVSFDTSFKVSPPLRTKKDVEFFKKAIKDGTIDLVVSCHRPQDTESKNIEFDLAEFGMTGLETVFPIINTFIPDISSEWIVEKLAVAPRKILNLAVPLVKEGEPANLTVFDTTTEWTFDKTSIKSKSKNSAFIGRKFKGKVVAVVNQGKYFLNN